VPKTDAPKRIFLSSGHMIDSPDRTHPRFPPSKEIPVRAAMDRALAAWNVRVGDVALCGGARGADILFGELCVRRGAQVVLMLPSKPESFIEKSVHLPGTNWADRFAHLLKQSELRLQHDVLGPAAKADNLYERNNQWMLDTAQRETRTHENRFMLLVWDGEPKRDGRGGTADLAENTDAFLPDHVVTIDPTTIETTYHEKTRDEHYANDDKPKRILTLDGGGVRGILTLQYLAKIEAILRERYNAPKFRLCHYFDLIAGTSTGAILASSLALGMSVSEIQATYNNLARQVFKFEPWRPPGFRAIFDSHKLELTLKDLLGEATTIGGAALLTGLLVMTKRMDTGSQWPLSNNPRGKYFDADRDSGAIPNKDYLLWEVVRASTAAPHYFDPVEIRVHPDEKVATFVDGGVSTANNPTLEAFKLATLKGFGLQWPTGAENMLVISCGTGRVDPSATPSKIAGKHALNALLSIMNDTSDLVETLMQWMSESPTSRAIDGEVGDFRDDLIAGIPLITYHRYNVLLEDDWVKKELGIELDAGESKELSKMHLPGNMERLAELGRISADNHLSVEHLPSSFDLV